MMATMRLMELMPLFAGVLLAVAVRSTGSTGVIGPAAAPTSPLTASLAPFHLRVEGLLEAVAVISEPTPRFSFLHGPGASPSFGVTQASYRITVAKFDTEKVMWDSGAVLSSNCSQIVYAGEALAPFTRYSWTAEWTSSAGDRSAASAARFETGRWCPPTGRARAGCGAAS